MAGAEVMPRQGVPVTGVLLAAGAGRRSGGAKALRRDPDGTSWLQRSVRVLRDGGCADVVVVLGSQAEQARRLLPDPEVVDPGLVVVECPSWDLGMSSSLQVGLTAARDLRTRGPDGRSLEAVLVHLVDLPDVTADVVARVLAHDPAGVRVLARAGYHRQPGHPVLIGTDHLGAILAELADLADRAVDVGARDYLARHQCVLVECGDLSSGQDRDFLG